MWVHISLYECNTTAFPPALSSWLKAFLTWISMSSLKGRRVQFSSERSVSNRYSFKKFQPDLTLNKDLHTFFFSLSLYFRLLASFSFLCVKKKNKNHRNTTPAEEKKTTTCHIRAYIKKKNTHIHNNNKDFISIMHSNGWAMCFSRWDQRAKASQTNTTINLTSTIMP